MNLLLIIFSAWVLGSCGAYSRRASNDLKTLFSWNRLEFVFPKKNMLHAIEVGDWVPGNGIPIDVQPHYYSNSLRVFVTIPRLQSGIPYTLATISNEMTSTGPLLEPYPNNDLHNKNFVTNCDHITSAFRVAITECNQMWVIDSGISNTGNCPPQLLLYDLNTDKLIHRYRFPSSLFTLKDSLFTLESSLFINLLAVVRDPPPRGSCRRTMVYVADTKYHGLVVYDFMQNKAWRVENRFMYPDPNHELHSLAGEKFVLMDGIFGLAADKQNLYFHPLASATEFAVPLRIIDNSTLFEDNVDNMYETFRPLGKRSSECGASAMDSNGNLYCVTLNPIELIVWNVNTAYNKRCLKKLPISSEELEFVSGMKVIRNHEGNEELWMISNRYQKFAVGKPYNVNEVNVRILVRPLADVSPSSSDDDLHTKLVFKN